MKPTEDYQKGCPEVGEIIIDDPLAKLPNDIVEIGGRKMVLLENHEDYVVVGDVVRYPIVILEPNEHVTAHEAKINNDRAREFAKKFCAENSDLLKRLADR